MVGGKTNDDIFAANVRSKEKKKQVKKKKKETYLLFHLRPAGLPSESEGEDSESTTHTDAHTRGTVGEAEGRRYRGGSIHSGVVCKVVEE